MTTVMTATPTRSGESTRVMVSVQSRRGMPELSIHGISTRSAQKTKERILAALHSSGIRLKAKRTIVTISLQSKSEAAHLAASSNSDWLDLAIVTALIQEHSSREYGSPKTAFIGSVSIDGHINGGSELVPHSIAAKQAGFTTIVAPPETAQCTRWLDGVDVVGIGRLTQLNAQRPLTHQPLSEDEQLPLTASQVGVLLENPATYRALVLAAAGGHHTLLIGPPGWGKTTAAQAIASLLPPLTDSMLEQVLLEPEQAAYLDHYLRKIPLVLCLQPTSSAQLLFGKAAQRGILTANHFGVSILDEVPLAQQSKLLGLRHYLDQQDSTSTPSAHQNTIIGTGNPCACGFWASTQECRCTKTSRHRYWLRVGEALIDRFQLFSWVNPGTSKRPASIKHITSDQQAIATARILQAKRFSTPFTLNAQADWNSIMASTHSPSEIGQQLAKLSALLYLSKRAQLHILRVARTIADLGGRESIVSEDILEAAQFRVRQADFLRS